MAMNELLIALVVLVLLILFWLLLPIKYDPSIWLRDWIDERRKNK
jgi:hypothetical protein